MNVWWHFCQSPHSGILNSEPSLITVILSSYLKTLCVHICVCVCLCLCTDTHTRACECMCVHQSSTLSILLNSSQFYLFISFGEEEEGQDLPLSLELMDSARLAGQHAPRTHLSLPAPRQCWVYTCTTMSFFHIGAAHLNSGPHVCTPDILLTEPCPQL